MALFMFTKTMNGAYMRKKDYELIAEVIKDYNQFLKTQKGQPVGYVLQELAERIAGTLELNGYKFDRQKFLQSCGIEESDGMTKMSSRLEKKLDNIIFQD